MFSVRSKFLLVLALLIPVIFAVPIAGIVGLGKIRDDAKELYSDNVRTITLTQRLESGVDRAYQLALRLILTSDDAYKNRLQEELAREIAAVAGAIDEVRHASALAERGRLERLDSSWQRFVRLARSSSVDVTRAGAAVAPLNDARALKVTRAAEPVTDLADEIIALEVAAAKETRNQTVSTHDSSQLTMLALAAVAALSGLAAMLWLIRDIVPRTREYSRFASAVASGAVSEPIQPRGSDELSDLGRTLNEMVHHREAERAYSETQAEFAQAMQMTEDEHESHELLKRHLERSLAGSEVVVLNRNNSDDRLEATTPVTPDSPLCEPLRDAEPRSCLAVRFGRTQETGPERTPLLECELCGRRASERSTCEPLLVSGEVIGSVLVQHAEPLSGIDRERIKSSVSQAAPVLANLRNLAIAELRASTDALTGLPNNRAVQENLKRMVAQALRASSGLGVAVLDLDHFKQINDTYGHDKGDEVLAAVGVALQTTIRDSDFAGRWGGEEFLILLPEVSREGALVAAEKIRKAVGRVKIVGVESAITASLGVALLPADGLDATTLRRNADRALYAAKAAGRNRVEGFATESTNGVPREPAPADQLANKPG